MRNKEEYIVCKQIATYLRLQYPTVIFHFDLAGLNLSRAQAGMMSAIQGGKGWPDLFIAEPSGDKHGLFLEIKADKVDLFQKKDRSIYKDDHIKTQAEVIYDLECRGYKANFAIGFWDAKNKIDEYLK